MVPETLLLLNVRGIERSTALVTGGGSGIGLAIACKLASGGAHVTICGRTEEKLVRAVEIIGDAAALSGFEKSRIGFAVADVTVEAEIQRAVECSVEGIGRLDILVANAGGSFHLGSILDADLAAVRSTVELNLIGTWLSVKHGAKAMSDKGGSIVCISSGAGHFPHRYLWAYGMSKAGIESLCKYAAEELGDLGIRVNAVQPGIIDDELMSAITSGGKLLDDYISQMPLGRVGTVDDVADAVRYLCGPESGWVTGICLPVDGGHHLRRGANYQLLFEPTEAAPPS